MRERSLGKVASSTGSQNQRQSSVKLGVQSAKETARDWAALCTSRKTVKARRMNIGTSISEYSLTISEQSLKCKKKRNRPVFRGFSPWTGRERVPMVNAPRRSLWERPPRILDKEGAAPKEQPAPETLRQMDRRRMGLWKVVPVCQGLYPPTK
jgi:hypothetical protein